MTQLSDREQQNLQQDFKLAERALRDSSFRQALMTDPRGTLERELGASIPEGMTIHVHEETDNEIHIVLPTRELEANLDDVAPMLGDPKKSKCCTCGRSTHQTLNV